MKRSKFTEEQIAFALHEADTGTSVEDLSQDRDIASYVLRLEEEVCRGWGGRVTKDAAA